MKIDLIWAYQVMLVVKNLSTNAGDIRGKGFIPKLGRSPGGGHSNPLQYSCLDNPMDREYSPWGCKRVRHDCSNLTGMQI